MGSVRHQTLAIRQTSTRRASVSAAQTTPAAESLRLARPDTAVAAARVAAGLVRIIYAPRCSKKGPGLTEALYVSP